VSHVDRLSDEDLSSMLEKLGTNGKLELHIIGAFADAMAISETLLVPVLGIIFYFFLSYFSRFYIILVTFIYRNIFLYDFLVG
jgi:hypothetical protein